MNILNKFENVLVGVGLTIGIANIKDILGIVLIVLQVTIILYKMGVSIYKKVQARNYDDILADLDKAQKELEELKNSLPDKEEHDGR